MPWQDVITGTDRWSVEQGDRLDWFNQLPADCLDLVIGSSPYEAARSYGIGFKLKGQAWVDWMVETFRAAHRCCKGVVAMVVEGQTRGYRWSATPALLMADLHRAGFHLRRPCIYHRRGIPGSGGVDWFKGDTEFVICVSRPGRLPWSENTAMGHIPKWAPGGEMSHRQSNGSRRNKWGQSPNQKCTNRNANGLRDGRDRKGRSESVPIGRRVVRGTANGDTKTSNNYDPPAIANPGNLITCKVGGGLMGSQLAHENEAPYSLRLAEWFVRSCCPPGGIVADCFSGSGTTGHAAIEWGRRFVGCDIRESQVKLTSRRLKSVQPRLFIG